MCLEGKHSRESCYFIMSWILLPLYLPISTLSPLSVFHVYLCPGQALPGALQVCAVSVWVLPGISLGQGFALQE